MPATRSSGQQTRSQPFPTSSPPRSQNLTATRRTKTTTPEIVPSSSSEADSSTTTTKKQPRKRTEKVKSRSRHPVVIPEDIIEISSDEETLPISKPTTTPAALLPEPAAIADFRRQISKYREESAKYKRDFEKTSKELAVLREENKELQALRNQGNGKIALDADKLTDHFDCEICTCRMWTPHVLPDCGHTFCQNCLQDWFSSTQAQFMTSHPGYDPNQLISDQKTLGLYKLAQALMRNPQAANSMQISALVTQLLPLHPQYTCPTCREPVKSRPTEAFALKALVRTVSSTMGESSPKRSKQSGKAPDESVWDGFFPARGHSHD